MSESEDDLNAQFFEQFLDDYFAESDEHLRSLRRNLLDLEDSLASGQGHKRTTLDEIFRSFHTLKGISAMAGVPSAEALAHSMESYLRLLREGEAELSEEGLSGLIRGTQKMEEVVNAKRGNDEMPPITDEIRQLESLAASGNVSVSELGPAYPVAEGEVPKYLFTFVSAPELAGRGVNVSSVRERLQAIGTILRSSPTVTPEGQVAFDFVVETNASEEEFRGWHADGIKFERARDIDAETSLDALAANGRTGPSASSSVVRVDLSRLDNLILMLGELVVSRTKLEEQLKRLGDEVPSELKSDLEETNHAIELQLRNLRDGVMRTRMSPIGEVFERLEFAVRDLARDLGKKARLNVTGENTEIDKMLVEKILDPLLHLVRNAVSHGIETVGERRAKGKPDHGTVRLHAAAVGDTIVIEVADDGAGVDAALIAEKARERGLLQPGQTLDEAGLLDVLCSPGFSSRERADKASGRGVGMDVVRRAVDELKGTLTLETRAGEGSTFRIQLPLTLAIADALIVTVDKERFAVPQAGVNEVIEIREESVRRLENNELIDHRGSALPIVRLSGLFGLSDASRDIFHAFVVGEGRQAVGVVVDRVVGQAEIVVRPLSDRLTQVPGISGATELGDGRIVLILDVPAITRRLRQGI